jgi:hypothetical protein
MSVQVATMDFGDGPARKPFDALHLLLHARPAARPRIRAPLHAGADRLGVERPRSTPARSSTRRFRWSGWPTATAPSRPCSRPETECGKESSVSMSVCFRISPGADLISCRRFPIKRASVLTDRIGCGRFLAQKMRGGIGWHGSLQAIRSVRSGHAGSPAFVRLF